MSVSTERTFLISPLFRYTADQIAICARMSWSMDPDAGLERHFGKKWLSAIPGIRET